MVTTGYGEQLKPYLVQTLTDLGFTVHEGPVPKTPEASWETPEVGVKMLGDTYGDINRTTCHAVITAIIECADKELAMERSNNLLAFVARRVLRNVELGMPYLAGVRAPWLPGSTVAASRPADDAMNPSEITLTWECSFLTPCGGI